MKKLIPAVVLSCHTMGLAVIRSLGLKGVPVIALYYQKGDMGYVSKYAKESIHTPHPEKYPQEFIHLLVSIANKIGPSVLIPADDATLSVVSKNRKILDQKFIVACTEWEITKKFIVKKYTYQLAEDIGISVPRTIVPDSIAEVESYGREIQYPCVAKPCESHKYFERFRRKMVKVDNLDQMKSAYQQAKEAGIEVMLQEFIPGDDSNGVNYNSYFWKGQAVIEFTAEKVRLSPPGFGIPRVVVSKDIPEIIAPGRKILKQMGFYGFSCTEFKKDNRDGIYKLMEVNGRHNRSALLAVDCGINFPWIEYKNLVQGEIQPVNAYQKGRYWIDEYQDLFSNAKFYKQENFSLKEYFRPYVGHHTFSVFDIDDVQPFFKRLIDLGKRLLSLLLPQQSNDIFGSKKGVSK